MADRSTSLEPVPPLADYFVPATLLGLIRRRHPYDFIETYEVLRSVYGYRAAYVNLGLWDRGADTEEAGRALAFAVLDELRLEPGDRLIDAGAGLGQAAVDSCDAYQLGEVVGINPNPRQVGFANRLAEERGLADRVHHRVADACSEVEQLDEAGYHGICAIECIGHFPEPDRFLAAAHRALRPGGRLAFCLNVRTGRFGFWMRRKARLWWGFVPEPLERWRDRLTAAGFDEIESQDLTVRVLAPVTAIVGDRVRGERGRQLSRLTRGVMRWQLAGAGRAVERGALGYALVTARKPR